MPINFGILAPLQQTVQPVTGPTMHAMPAKDPLADFSNGLMGGITQGQQIQQNSQNLQEGELKLNAAKQGAADYKELRASAAQGWDQYLKTLKTQDPVAAVDAQTKMATLQKTQADAKDADAKEYKSLVDVQGNFYGQVSQGRNDQEKAAIWAMQRENMPKSVQDAIPEKYDQNTLMAGMTIHQFDVANTLEKNPKLAAEGQSPLGKIQSDADKKQQLIANMKAKGLDTSQQEQELTQLNQASTSEANPAQKAFDSAAAQHQEKMASDLTSTRGTIHALLTDNADAKAKLKDISEAQLGPLVNYLKLNALNPDVQELNKLTSEMPFLNKSLVGISAGMRFTQGELDQLNRITGGPGTSKKALQWLFDRTEAVGTRKLIENWHAEDAIHQNESPGQYKLWLKNNPEPQPLSAEKAKSNVYLHPELVGGTPNSNTQSGVPDGRVIMVDSTGKVGHVPVDQVQEAIKSGYKLQQPGIKK